METRTFLHMVYAGRGDAFIIEYLDDSVTTAPRRAVILVDGGPTTYTANRETPNAPYYKYLYSAAKEIWKRARGPSAPVFTPDAIFISHCHDDHYGGLLQMIQANLPPRSAAGPNDGMYFDGPLVIPVAVDKNGKKTAGFLGIDRFLERHDFGNKDGYTASLDVDMAYPDSSATAARIKTYKRPLVPGRDHSPDASPDNLLSLLMTHEVTNSTGQLISNMFFTGDSAGYVVNEFIPDTSTQPLSIYKIQHHGSLRNVQSDDYTPEVNERISNEAQLRAVLEWSINQDDSFLPKRIRSFINTVNLSNLDNAITIYLILIKYPKAKATILTDLQARDATYRQQAQVVGTLTLDPPDTEYSNLWLFFVKWIGAVSPAPPEFYTTEPRGRSEALKVLPELWWAQYMIGKEWEDKYLAILTTVRARTFFASFNALSYVVSCNQSHGHVAAETIVGLAWAILNKHQTFPTPLYITDGASVSLEDIQFLCSMFNETIAKLFPTNGLTIQFLRSRTYMTLDATINTTITPAGRDVGSRTLQWESFARDTTSFSDLHAQMEKDKTLLPNRSLGNDRYHLRFKIGLVDWFLTLLTLVPGFSASVPTIAYGIVEAWEDDQVPPLGPDRIRVVPASSVPSFIVKVEHADPPTSRTWKLYPIVGPFQTLFGIYANNSTNQPEAIPISTVPPIGYTEITTFDFIKSGPGLQESLPSLELLLQFSSVISPVIQSNLRDYCKAADVSTGPSFSGADAFAGVVGIDNYTKLNFNRKYQQIVLAYPADLDNSQVNYVETGINIVVDSAAIVLLPPPGSTLEIGGEDITVGTVTIDIIWTETMLTSILTIKSIPKENLTFTTTRTLDQAVRSTDLDMFLADSGFKPADIASVTVGKLLAFLLNSDNKALERLSQIPSGILLQDLMYWKPDHRLSSVVAVMSPTNQIQVMEARLVCDVAMFSVTLAGITMAMREVEFVLTNPGLLTKSLVLQGSASITTTEDLDVTLSVAIKLEESGSSLRCSLSGSNTLSDLESILPGGSNIGSAQVPFADSPLSTLTTSGMGFVLTSPIPGLAQNEVDSVFGAVSFDQQDWQSYLPTGFPSPVSATIRLEVLHPLDNDSRAARVGIDFTASIPSGPTTKTLQAAFVAEPLFVPTDYEFRVRLSAAANSDPATLAEILDGIGVGGVVNTLRDAIPVVGNVLDSVSVNEVSAAVVRQGDPAQWLFQDYLIDINISDWTIVDKALILDTANIRVESNKDSWNCEAFGQFSIQAGSQNINHVVDVAFRVPTSQMPGYFNINNPGQLSAGDVLTALGLPDLRSLPVVGPFLNIVATFASVTVGTESNDEVRDAPLVVLGGQADFVCEQLNLGLFALTSLEVSVSYVGSADPLGNGKEQRMFSLDALLADESFEVEVSYSTLTNLASGTLRPLKDITITDALNMLLGTTDCNKLLPLIGDLKIFIISISLLAPDFTVQSFSAVLERTATREVSGVTLNSLSIEYKAAVPTQPGKPGTPMTYTLFGQTIGTDAQADIQISCVQEIPSIPTFQDGPSKSRPRLLQGDIASVTATDVPPMLVTASVSETPGGLLKMSGLFSMFGIGDPQYAAPPGSPTLADFLNLEIKEGSGEVSVLDVDGMMSLRLDSLKILVQTTTSLVVLETPKVVLNEIRLAASWRRDESTTGYVSASLTLPGGAALWLAYIVERGGPVYIGTLTLQDISSQFDFTAMASEFSVPPSAYQMPPNIGVPSLLPCANIGGKIYPGTSLEVWGSSGATSWSFTCAGVDVSLQNVGAGFTILNSAEVTAITAYTAYLFGDVSFTGFTSAVLTHATMRIGSQQSPILTAVIRPEVLGDAAQITNLVTNFTGDDQAWQNLLPSSTSLMVFGNSVWARIDINSSEFTVLGDVGFGGGLLMSRLPYKSSQVTSQGFFFSLAVKKIGLLWSSLSDILDKWVDFSDVGVEFMGLKGNMGQLKADLAQLNADASMDGIVVASAASTLTLPDDTAIVKGVTAFATINFSGSTSLSTMLGLAADNNQPSTVTLWAQIPKEGPKPSTYAIQVDKLVIFGGAITIQGTGIYTATSSTYTFNAEGTLDLALTSKNTYTFDIDLSVDSNSTRFLVKAGSPRPDIDQPFDGQMFGVELVSVGIEGTFTAKEKILTLSGTVKVGSLGSRLECAMIFYNGVPMIVSLALKDDISVIDIFSAIIDSGGGSGDGTWPKGYQIITFKEGGKIYYSNSPTAIRVAGFLYEPAYHIWAPVEILGYTFLVTASMPANRSGIVVKGSLQGEINWVFVTLGAYSESDPGPTIGIDTTEPLNELYFVRAKIAVFDLVVLPFLFSWESGVGWFGEVKYSGTILGCKDPSFVFEYYDNSVHVKLPALLQNLIDIAKLIMRGSELVDASTCGVIAGMAFDEVVSSEWQMNLINLRPIPPVAAADLVGTLKVNVGPISVKVHLPTIPITISIFESSSILENIKSNLENNLDNIATALYNDKTALMEILATVGAVNWGKNAVKSLATMLCRSVVSGGILAAAMTTAETTMAFLSGPSSPVVTLSTDSKASLSAGTISEAARDLLKAKDDYSQSNDQLEDVIREMQLTVKYETDVGKIAELNKFILDAKNLKTQADTDWFNAQSGFENSLMMGMPTVTFVASDTVNIIWDGAMPSIKPILWYEGYDPTKWTFEISIGIFPSFESAETLPATTGIQSTVQRKDFVYAPVVYVWMRAIYDNQFHSASWGPQSNAEHAVILPAPPPLNFRITPDGLACQTATAVTVPAGDYEVQIFDVDIPANILAVETLKLLDGGNIYTRTSIRNFDVTGTPSKLGAQARMKSGNERVPDSAWTVSEVTFPTFGPPPGFDVSIVSADPLEIFLKYNSGWQEFDLDITKQDGTWNPDVKAGFEPSRQGTTIWGISGGDIVSGVILEIAMRLVRNPTQEVSLWASVTDYRVSQVPWPIKISTLNLDTWYDMVQGTFHITFYTNFEMDDFHNYTAVIWLQSANGPLVTLDNIPITKIDPLTASVELGGFPYTDPNFPNAIHIGLVDSGTGEQGNMSPAWNVPVPPPMDAVKPVDSADAEYRGGSRKGFILVIWYYGPNPPPILYVDIMQYGKVLVPTQQTAMDSRVWTLNMDDYDNLFPPPQLYDVRLTSGANNIRGQSRIVHETDNLTGKSLEDLGPVQKRIVAEQLLSQSSQVGLRRIGGRQ